MIKDPGPKQPEGTSETDTGAGVEQRETRERRARTLLVCPENDTESHMILLLAERMGMAVLRSEQKHGAKLAEEPNLIDRVKATKKGEVWIVEIPGPELEAALREEKLDVQVIDHHTYGTLNRAVNGATGARNTSSLEQFMEKADIADEELVLWGLNPKTVRGVGIFDDRFAQGLRDAGYTLSEIAAVMDTVTQFSRTFNPQLEQVTKMAEQDWAARELWRGYILIRSNAPLDIRGAIGFMAIREGLDTTPTIISALGGKKLYVHEIPPAALARVQEQLPMENTFTFGGTRCWGYDSKQGPLTITLEQLQAALEEPKEG